MFSVIKIRFDYSYTLSVIKPFVGRMIAYPEFACIFSQLAYLMSVTLCEVRIYSELRQYHSSRYIFTSAKEVM